MIGGLAGGFYAHSPVPLIQITRPDCQPSASGIHAAEGGSQLQFDEARLAALLAESRGFNLETAARIGSLESLLEELRLHDVPPSQLVASLVDHMREDEIYSLMGDLVSLDRVHLEEIEDVRAFATRLAEVALAGSFEPIDEDGFARSGEVLFATERELDDPASVASTVFGIGEPIIHAMIPIGELRNEQTLLKWIRVEPPQIVAFRRLSLLSEQAYYSYGLRRSGALEPGHYRVEIYRVNDDLTPIAVGSYAIE